MEFALGRLKTTHNRVVADINDECILGRDFLTPHECVDLKVGVLSIKGEQVPLQKPREI